MRRRDFIAGLGSVAVWSVVGRGQQSAVPTIGFLSSRSPGESAGVVAAFKDGLYQQGFIEGKNVAIAFRWAEGRYDRLTALAAELVALPASVLLAAGGQPSALAARKTTTLIPIVFSGVYDPVELGLVASLNQPGGNITGMSMFGPGVFAKDIQMLKEMVPTANLVGYLVNPANPAAATQYTKDALIAGTALGINVSLVNASAEPELDEAFSALAKLTAGGLIVPGEPFFDSQRDRIVALAARYRIPTIYSFREYVIAGGLISYGTSVTDSYRRAGIYVGRILRGEKPTDLPIQQPTKFELIINVKAAKALGLTVPRSILLRADEVIE
jgi:putative tryptophan/tyrosine transport system substrate-binding protein